MSERDTSKATEVALPTASKTVVDRAWLNETWLELRASLEGALMALDRLGRLEHRADCDSYNACHNAECDCPEDEGEAGCVTHDTTSCTCLVFDAASKARDVRAIIERTTPPAWRRLEGAQVEPSITNGQSAGLDKAGPNASVVEQAKKET